MFSLLILFMVYLLVLNFGPASRPTKKEFYIYFEYFESTQNHMFYKMTHLPLSQSSDHDKQTIKISHLKIRLTSIKLSHQWLSLA